MKRTLVATSVAVLTAFAVHAEDAAKVPDPGASHPPQNSMDKATPQMKSPGKAEDMLPATKAVDSAVPPMKAGDAPAANTGTSAQAPTPAPAATPAVAPSASPSIGPKLTLSDDQAKKWIGKTIYSSDNKNIGEVGEFRRTNNEVTELQAEAGGFLGIGEKLISFTPDKFSLKEDTVVLNVTKADVDKMMSIEKK